MVDRVKTGLYAFDPAGNNPANLISGERQTLTTPNLDDYFFIIPFAAPFFVDSLQLWNDQTNTPYVEGVDYLVGHYFVEAMNSVGRPVAGSIRFMRRNIGGVVRIKYHTIGGPWGFNDNAILEELSNRQFNPLIRSWGMVSGLPATFPPLPHDQSVDDLVGSDDLLDGLDKIADAIAAASEGSTAAHLDDYNNPHRVTKDQVGLSQVANYPPSSEAQARAGTADNAYMTPLRTSQAIKTLASDPLESHKDDLNNPHRVTAQHVGLEQVRNYPVASATEAIDPSRNDRYMTPYTAYLLLQQVGEGGNVASLQELLGTHVEDYSNPHNVTAEQTGGYSRETIDQLFDQYVAANSERLGGLTADEWREGLPSFDTISALIDFLSDEYTEATGIIGAVPTNITPAPQRPTALAVLAGHKRYMVARSGGGAVVVPPVAQWDDTLAGIPELFSFNSTAHYYINDAGLIETINLGGGIMPPAAFRAGSTAPISAKATNIIARDNAVYVLLDDDVLHRFTASGSEVVASDIEAMFAVLTGPEKLVLIRTDGSTMAIGDNNYGTRMSTVLNSLTDVSYAAVCENETYVMFEDGRLRCWSHQSTASDTTVSVVTLPLEMANDITTVSGGSRHAVILDESGRAHTRGDNTYGQLEIIQQYGPFAEVSTHIDYTVTVSTDGSVFFWGTDDTNEMRPPADRLGAN